METKLRSRSTLNSDPSAPLIVLIHGRAGNLNVMWNFSKAFPENVSVVSFEAHLPDPDDGGFSWVLLSGSLKEDLVKASKLFQENLENWILENKLTPSGIIGIGFSQGGVLLSDLIQRTPLFQAAAILSGFVFQSTETTETKARVFMFHGTEDKILSFAKAEEGRDYLINKGFSVEWHTEQVGHKVGIKGMRALKEFLNA